MTREGKGQKHEVRLTAGTTHVETALGGEPDTLDIYCARSVWGRDLLLVCMLARSGHCRWCVREGQKMRNIQSKMVCLGRTLVLEQGTLVPGILRAG